MKLLVLPVKMLGWAAAGLALGIGWKLGSYILNAAAADENVQRFFEDWKGWAQCCGEKVERDEPLWKRKFQRFSDD